MVDVNVSPDYPKDMDRRPMADPQAQREAWLSVVKPAAEAGRLDKIPAHKGTSKRGRDVAQKQNYWLTRKVFGGFGDNYDRINWNR